MSQKFRITLSRGNPVSFSILLLIGAFLLRIIKVYQDTVIAHDGILYIKMAKIVASGDLGRISEYSFFNLYPVLIILAQSVFGDWELSGRMVSAILGALTVIPLFLMVRKMIDQRVALITSLLYLISPHFIECSSEVLRESSFWFFSMMALWSAWEGIGEKKWYLLSLSGIFTGLASFTRIEGLAVFIVIFLWIVLFLRKKGFGLKKTFAFLLIFAFSFPLLISPSLWIIKTKLGRWEFGQVGGYLKNLPYLIYGTEKVLEVSPDVLEKTAIQFKGFLEISKRHRYILFISEVLYKFFKSHSIVFFFLLLFGILRRKSIPYSGNEWAILLWFGVFFLLSFFYMTKHYYFSTRHGLLMGFPALIWSGIGFYELKDRIESWAARKKGISSFARFTVLILILLVLLLTISKTFLSSQDGKIVLKKTGSYLKASGYSNLKFAGQPEFIRVAFYADSEYVLLPPGKSFEETMKFIKENQVSLLVIDEKSIAFYSRDLAKELNPLNFEKIPMPSLKVEEGYSIALYRIR